MNIKFFEQIDSNDSAGGLRRGYLPAVGGLCRLHPGHAHLPGDHEAAQPSIPEDQEHRPVFPGQSGRLRPGQGRACSRDDGPGQVGGGGV